MTMFFLGLIIGGMAGVVVMAMMQINRGDD